MKQVVSLELDDGSPVYVEVEEDTQLGLTEVGRRKRGTEDKTRFRAALERIKPAADAVVRVFREINSPEEVTLEFSMNFNTKVGAFLFSSATDALMKVSLTWKNPPPERASDR